jgi:hypothetical protein
MKALLCLLLVVPTMAFANLKCQVDLSPTDKLFFAENVTSVTPMSSEGIVNIEAYKEFIDRNLFARPNNQVQEYKRNLTKIESTPTAYGLHYGASRVVASKTETIEETKELVASKKKELLDLIARSTVKYNHPEEKYKLYLKDDKTKNQYAIDFRLPISANPVLTSSDEGLTGVALDYTAYTENNGLLKNTQFDELLSGEKLEIVECDRQVASLVRTKIINDRPVVTYDFGTEDEMRAKATLKK